MARQKQIRPGGARPPARRFAETNGKPDRGVESCGLARRRRAVVDRKRNGPCRFRGLFSRKRLFICFPAGGRDRRIPKNPALPPACFRLFRSGHVTVQEMEGFMNGNRKKLLLTLAIAALLVLAFSIRRLPQEKAAQRPAACMARSWSLGAAGHRDCACAYHKGGIFLAVSRRTLRRPARCKFFLCGNA